MKEIIKKYFKEDRSHKGGVEIYMKFGNRIALKKQLNITPPSEYLTGVLHEELRQLAGIDPKEFRLIMSNPVHKQKFEAVQGTEPKHDIKPDPEHHPLPPVKEPLNPDQEQAAKKSRRKK